MFPDEIVSSSGNIGMRTRVAIIKRYAISPPVPHVHGLLRAPALSRPLAGVPVPLDGPPPGRGHGDRPLGHSPHHGLPPGGARHPRGASASPRALPERKEGGFGPPGAARARPGPCLLYTSDAADDLLCVDLGGRRIIKKKKQTKKKQIHLIKNKRKN